MDGLSLYKVASILNKRFAGAKLNKISVADDHMVLQLYSGEKVNICIRVSGADPGVFIGDDEIQVKADPLKVMNGSVVKSIETRSYDRLMTFVLEKRRPSGKQVKYSVVAEMVGRNSNVFILNDSEKIIFSINSNNVDRDRVIGMGVKYQPFKLNKQWDLNDIGDVGKFNDLIGFYPVTAKHAGTITERCISFAEAATFIKERIDIDEKFYIDEKMKIVPFKIDNPLKILGISDLSNVGQIKKQEKSTDRKKKLESYFNKKLKKYKHLLLKLGDDLKKAVDFESLYAEAEMLKGNLHIILGNTGVVTLYKYLNNGIEEVEFVIDSSINYEKKVHDLFKKANRLHRSVPRINERINEIESCIGNLMDDLYFLEDGSDEDVNEMYTDIFMSKHKVKKGKDKNQFIKYHFEDAIYYVGRNSVINHELVFGFARSADLWFHAQKIPSGHLILRKDGMPTDEEIEVAARIVAFYSKHSKETSVQIDYVQKKHVKKPKNTPLGFVIYHHFKSVGVKPFTQDELLDMLYSSL